MAGIMKCGNMGLYPTKAEGWCLPAMESIACGVPTAVTNYSAPVDFIDETNSRPIKNFEMAPAHDGVFFKGDVGDWAVPDKDEIAQAIQDGLDGKIPTVGKEFGEKWSWKNSALKAKNILIETGVIPEETWHADTIREESSIPITGSTTGPAVTVEGSPRNDKSGVPSGEDNGPVDGGEDDSDAQSIPGGAGDPSEASL